MATYNGEPYKPPPFLESPLEQQGIPEECFYRGALYTGNQKLPQKMSRQAVIEFKEINRDKGTLYGALKVFSTDDGDRYLWMTTFFNGEIIDGKNFFFRSSKNKGTNDTEDASHWLRLGCDVHYISAAFNTVKDKLNYQQMAQETRHRLIYMRFLPETNNEDEKCPPNDYYYAVIDKDQESLTALFNHHNPNGVDDNLSIKASYGGDKSYAVCQYR